MEDANLVRQLIAGDTEAFDRIYQKYSTMLYRTAYLLYQDKYDVEDILQDTFITLYQKASEIKKPESLKCMNGKQRDLARNTPPLWDAGKTILS